MTLAMLSLIGLIAISGLTLVFFMALKNQNRKINLLQSQLAANEFQLNDLLVNLHQQNQEITAVNDNVSQNFAETSQVSRQLEHRIKTLQQDLLTMKDIIEQQNSLQPEDKLYSRALKLAALGADVDEIVQECGIPLAEAEMLLAVHQHNQSHS